MRIFLSQWLQTALSDSAFRMRNHVPQKKPSPTPHISERLFLWLMISVLIVYWALDVTVVFTVV